MIFLAVDIVPTENQFQKCNTYSNPTTLTPEPYPYKQALILTLRIPNPKNSSHP